MISFRNVLVLFTVASAMLLMVGCGHSGPETIPVKGTVTLAGEPLPNAIVTFIPEDGSRSANGMTDSAGRFTLSTFRKGDGVIAGQQKVCVMPKDPPPMPGDEFSSPGGWEDAGDPGSYTPPFPNRYGLPTESGLEALVEKGGDNNFTFDLQLK